MQAALHPGVPKVYRRARRTAEEPSLRLVRTDIAGFLGYAERGPLSDLKEPESGVLRLTSWAEFASHYGGFLSTSYLAYAVRAFFTNGGEVCYVARIAALRAANPPDRPARARWVVPTGPATAASEGFIKGRTLQGVTEIGTIDPGMAAGQLIQIESAGDRQDALVLERVSATLRLARPLAGTPALGAEDPKLPPLPIKVALYKTAFSLAARSEGTWGNSLEVTVTALDRPSDVDGGAGDFSMRITRPRSPGQDGPPEEEFYPRLSLKAGQYFVADRLAAFSNLVEAEVPASNVKLELPSGRVHFSLAGGRDGLAAVEPSDFIGGEDDLRGLRLFENFTEIGILCVPDAVLSVPPAPPHAAPPTLPCQPPAPPETPPDPSLDPPSFDNPEILQIQHALLDHCERLRDRFAILDFPDSLRKVSDLVGWRLELRSPYGALYYPWVLAPDALGPAGSVRAVPPCGHVAGAYARVDRSVGVHLPPANVELEFATDLAVDLDDDLQQELNPNDINAIRSFAGRGLRIWGARSLAGPGQKQWRFIHARRLMNMIEESIEKSMKWAVYEPNDETLRETLRHSIEVFLDHIWRRGGLNGERREDAYYVRCDETNNPPSMAGVGRVLCTIGVKIATALEFIIFELRPAPSGTELEAREV